MCADTLVVKKTHERDPRASEEELMEKHRDVEGKGEKAMNTNTGGSPAGYQNQFQQPGNSPSEEVRGHCTPTGCVPRDRYDTRYDIQLRYNAPFVFPTFHA